jgi:hypothetical protein
MLNRQNKILSRSIFILGIVLLLVACEGRPKGVLNQNEMTSILTDLHKLDGCLYEKGYQFGHFPDKAPYYNFVLKKHGITQAEFDSSLVWYTKNPKKFEKIYTDVLIQLTNLDNEIKAGKYHPFDSAELAIMRINLWKKGIKYNFTKDSTRTNLNFEIADSTLLLGDVYILKFLQRIAPEDSSTNRHAVLRINYANGKTDSVYCISHNDSLLRRYTFRLSATKKLKIKSLSGELLGSTKYKGKFHVLLDSISLTRKYNVLKQDSLRKVVQKVNSILKIQKSKPKLVSIRRQDIFQNIKENN